MHGEFQRAAPLVTMEGMPFWVVVEKNLCKTFLLACSAVADIQEQVNGNIDVTSIFFPAASSGYVSQVGFQGPLLAC